MKLNPKLLLAATTVAVAFASINAQAQAASIVYSSKVGNTYNFQVLFDNASEVIGAGSLWGVQVPSNTTSSVKDTDSAIAKGFFGFASLFEAKVNVTAAEASKLDFSITSPTADISKAAWFFNEQAPSPDFNPSTPFGGSQPVPEPLTMGGTAVALGLGYLMKRKKEATLKA